MENLMRPQIVLLALTLICTTSAHAQQAVDRGPSITMRGEGRVDAAPDHARLAVTVTTSDANMATASTSHRSRASKAAAVLHQQEANGLEIERSDFRLDRQQFGPMPGQPTPRIDYQAVTTFALKLKRLDKIDEVITAIAGTGLFEMNGLNYGLEDMGKTLNEARTKAGKDALERATTYARAVGVNVGDVKEIVEGEFGGGGIRPMAAMSSSGGRSMEVTPPQSLSVAASVTITWGIKPLAP
jgi:uncharacterized protein YggE